MIMTVEVSLKCSLQETLLTAVSKNFLQSELASEARVSQRPDCGQNMSKLDPSSLIRDQDIESEVADQTEIWQSKSRRNDCEHSELHMRAR